MQQSRNVLQIGGGMSEIAPNPPPKHFFIASLSPAAPPTLSFGGRRHHVMLNQLPHAMEEGEEAAHPLLHELRGE